MSGKYIWIEAERNTQSSGGHFQIKNQLFSSLFNCFLQSDLLSDVCERLCKVQGSIPRQGFVFIVIDQGIGDLRSSQELETFLPLTPGPSLCNLQKNLQQTLHSAVLICLRYVTSQSHHYLQAGLSELESWLCNVKEVTLCLFMSHL